MKSDGWVFEVGKGGDQKDLGRRVARGTKGSTKDPSPRPRNIHQFPRQRGMGRLCAKALAYLTMSGIILLFLSLMILHAWRDLYLQVGTVRCVTPVDIAALFGYRGR